MHDLGRIAPERGDGERGFDVARLPERERAPLDELDVVGSLARRRVGRAEREPLFGLGVAGMAVFPPARQREVAALSRAGRLSEEFGEVGGFDFVGSCRRN